MSNITIQKNKLLTARYDKMFKTIMLENKDILEKVLETIVNKSVEIIDFVNQEMPIMNKNERVKRLDLIIKLDGEYYECEVNTSPSMATRVRNLNYFFSFIVSRAKQGNMYDIKTKYVQINLTFGMDSYYGPQKYGIIEEYQIKTNENKVYYDNFKIIEVNMDKINKLWYAKSELEIEKFKYLIMLDIKEKEELEKISKGDVFMEKYQRKLEELNSNEEFVYGLTWEEELEMIKNAEVELARESGLEKGLEKGIKQGVDQGAEQKSIEIAKKLIEEGESLERIQRLTSLDEKRLIELKEKIKEKE